jgi:hypothetical protein
MGSAAAHGNLNRSGMARSPSQCPYCGFTPTGSSPTRRLRADLEIEWLTEVEGRMSPVRYCQACAPNAGIGEVMCVGCGDGPLLAGDVATDLLLRWLIDHGWSVPSGMTADARCPSCAPRSRRP